MDLGKLATQDNANGGVWTQVELYEEKQDLDLCLYGDDSDVVKTYLREQLRNRATAKKNKNGGLSEEAINELIESENDLVVIKVKDFRCHSKHDEEITLDGTAVTHDEDGVRKLIKAIPEIKDFITKFCKERENFLPKGKKN